MSHLQKLREFEEEKKCKKVNNEEYKMTVERLRGELKDKNEERREKKRLMKSLLERFF